MAVFCLHFWAVYCGQTVFGTEIVSRIPDLLQGEKKFDYGKYDINEREFEMIELIANGYSNKEIAAELFPKVKEPCGII